MIKARTPHGGVATLSRAADRQTGGHPYLEEVPMTYPNPGADPNPSQGGAPQGQPGWGSPEQPGWGGPQQPGYNPAPSYSGGPAGYGTPAGQRPGMVTAAGIVGIVWGALGALFGLLLVVAAFGLGAGLAGLVLLIGLAVAAALLVGGIRVLNGKSPKLLLYVCYASIVINIISLVVSLVSNGGNAYSGVLGFIVPGAIIALLLQPQSKQYFAARGQTY
jgi:hypothetical protein